MKRVTVSLVWCLALVACGGSTPERLSPYSADEWRSALVPGAMVRYRIEVPRNPEAWERELVVADVTAAGATLVSTLYVEDGFPTLRFAPSRTRVTWRGLVRETSFPGAGTQVRRAYIETQAGNFEALLYIVSERTRDGQLKVTRLWFADALPGVPVRHEIELDGKVVSRLVLVDHKTG